MALRTAEEVLNSIIDSKEYSMVDYLTTDMAISAINEARKEAIEEAAKKAKAYKYGNCKILDLLTQIK